MTDDFNDLKQALGRAVPRPDPARKEAAIQAALRAHDDFFDQAAKKTAPGMRPTGQSRFWSGLIGGAEAMFKKLTTTQALAGTSVIALAAFVTIAVLPRTQGGNGDVTPAGRETAAGPARTQDSLRIGETERRDTPAQPSVPPNLPATEAQVARNDLTPAGSPGATGDPAVLPEPVPEQGAPDSGLSRQAVDSSGGAEVFNDEISLTGTAVTEEAEIDELRAMAVPEPNIAPTPLASDRETFPNAEMAGVLRVADAPVSTFSSDVDTASYTLARSSLTAGQLPAPESVRPEEFVNYFHYNYPVPEADGPPFRPTISVLPTPWNPDTTLIQIGIQGRTVDLADRPPLNAVFLIDTSGSMQDANKLPLVKQSLTMLARSLREGDEIAIVTYAGSAGVELPPTDATDRWAIEAALARLGAGGSTAGQAGLEQAYAVAEAMTAEGETTRVYLATDGDFNVGLSSPEAMEALIAKKRRTGAYLSVLSFGRGNIRDDIAQALAQAGNGQAAYIDSIFEAKRVLVDEQGGALVPIAGDLKLQVEFNPAAVSEYRLIGYETRALAREDFNKDAVDAGDIGAGHQVTAMYEVAMVGAPGFSDPLRYVATGDTDAVPGANMGELAWLKMRWKEPGEDTSQLIEQPIPTVLLEAMDSPSDQRFAAAIAGFAELLRGSELVRNWGYDDAVALARDNRGDDPTGARAEAIRLMELAGALAQ